MYDDYCLLHRYHYYGLSIKDSSPYSSIVQGTQRVNHLNDYEVPITPNFHPRTVRLSADGSKIVLEGFPSVLSVPLPAALKDKVGGPQYPQCSDGLKGLRKSN